MAFLAAFLTILADLNIHESNDKLISIALVLAILIMLVVIIGWLLGHIPRRGP